MLQFTKTFTENRWYQRVSPTKFIPVAVASGNDDLPIDKQVRDWVLATENVITDPGQLGMHTEWHPIDDNAYALKCIVLGLTVLYQENEHVKRPGRIAEPDNAGDLAGDNVGDSAA